MDLQTDIQRKESICAQLKLVNGEIVDFYEGLSLDLMFSGPEKKWTPYEVLIHLLKSVKPVAMALKVPKVALKLKFGTPTRKSKSFEELLQDTKESSQVVLMPENMPRRLNRCHNRIQKRRHINSVFSKSGQMSIICLYVI